MAGQIKIDYVAILEKYKKPLPENCPLSIEAKKTLRIKKFGCNGCREACGAQQKKKKV